MARRPENRASLRQSPWPESVTAADVVAWFQEAPIKRLPRPDAAMVFPLVQTVNLYKWIGTPSGETAHLYSQIEEARGHRLAAAKAAAGACQHLTSMVEILDGIADGRLPDPEMKRVAPCVRQLLVTLDAFLVAYPPRGPGRDRRGLWIECAQFWARRVEGVLVVAGWTHPSTTGDNAVVPFILAKMVKEIFGTDVKPESIARYLRQLRSEARPTPTMSAG